MGGVLENLGPMAVGLGGIAGAAVAAGSALLHLSESLSSTAVQLRNQSIVTGLTAEDMQAMNRLGKEATSGIKQPLRAYEELPRVLKQWEEAYNAAQKIQEEINTRGHAALVPSGAQMEAGGGKGTELARSWLADYEKIQRQLGRDATTVRLDELRLEEQITACIIPRNNLEREQVEIRRIQLQFEIKSVSRP